ncbi:NTP transferase domain-containing protein [Myxococcota bacterium]|nr:NTP transferase domain-containing protein [Myxococcota bacterium]
MSSTSPVPAVVLAAGHGTRMKSRLAKVLHPVCGRPMVARAALALLRAGCAPVVVVVGHQADAVAAAVRALGDPRIQVAVQAEQRGTGDAVAAAEGDWAAGEGPFVVVPGDVALLVPETVTRLLAAHAAAAGPVTFLTSRPADPAGYGRVVRDGAGSVERIVEAKDATPEERRIGEVNAGVYAFERSFVFGAGGALAALRPDNAQGELYLTDVVAEARRRGLRVAALEHGDARELAGVNDRAELAAAEAALYARTADRWMREGVTVRVPSLAWVEPEVELSPDVVVEPGAAIRGNTTVGTGAWIGPGALLADCAIGEGASIGPGCVLTRVTVEEGATLLPYTVAHGVHEKDPAATTEGDRVVVGPGARIGPLAHLRPASRLGAGVHVGNFVEVKNVVIGRGSKANHLAYLGDGSIGEECNVGAGVIFCNYDGFQKQRTVIEDGAFVGSDSQLVAPVVVGRGAYVGSGSTITRNVPPGSLSIARARQVDLQGRADQMRSRRLARQAAADRAAEEAAARGEGRKG